MEKDIALGTIGDIKLSFAGGKAMLEIVAKADALGGSAAVEASVKGSMDAGALVDMLFAAIEAKTPAAAPIEEAVKSVVKSAVLAIV